MLKQAYFRLHTLEQRYWPNKLKQALIYMEKKQQIRENHQIPQRHSNQKQSINQQQIMTSKTIHLQTKKA